MTATQLIELSAVLEPWIAIAVGAILVTLSLERLFGGGRAVDAWTLDAPLAASTERRLLGLVLFGAVVVRLVGWDSALTPAWWFSEVSVLPVDKVLHDGTLWAVWKGQLAATKIDFAHEATSVLALLAGLDALIGPRFGLSVIAGAFMGGLVVLLAWAVGRHTRSQAFGLVFASLVAVSPLQLMWSRLSPMCTEAVAHALLALLVGWLAGRHGSILAAAATGMIAWTSFQQYYAARAAVPFAVIGIVAGAFRSWRPARGLALILVAVLAFGLVDRAVHGSAFGQGLWPTYAGYLGNKGERTLLDLVERNREAVVSEASTTLAYYFAKRRTGWESDVRKPGIAEGGLTSPAMAGLGIVGLMVVVCRCRRQWPWLVVAAIGLAMPSLSRVSARRTLLFDVAWCAFAAHGLLALADRLGVRFAYRARAGAVGVTVVLLALWTSVAVFALSAVVPASYGQHIPFGEAGFGDGTTCKRCLEAAMGWQRDIADGAFVVLFDNDKFRENRTSPGGLPAFGKIAALAAGRREAFIETYALMGDSDIEPPTVGAIFDRAKTTFVDELEARMDRVAPRRIVWHFERPTAWERWLAERLGAAGGVLEAFSTPLSASDGIRVTTPGDRRADAMAVIRELAIGLVPGGTSCFRLVPAGTSTSHGNVFLLASGDDGVHDPPRWVVGNWGGHLYGEYELSTSSPPIGVHVAGQHGAERIEFLGQDRRVTVIDTPSLRRQELPSNIPGTAFGYNCGAWAAGHWWVVEPWTGQIVSSHPAAAAIPASAWVGVAATPTGEVVLASATQEILVFDPAHEKVVTRFPARVPPSVRIATDECTPIAVGADWVGIANLRTTVLSLYARDGRDLGTQRLDRIVDPGPWLSTIGGAGRYLGVPTSAGVQTLEVNIEATCSAAETAAP